MTTVTVPALAREFARLIREYLPEHLKEIRRLNAQYAQEYPGHSLCATGDFCDSNMIMLEAYSRLSGIPESEVDLEQTMSVMNDAWDMAKAAGFAAEKL